MDSYQWFHLRRYAFKKRKTLHQISGEYFRLRKALHIELHKEIDTPSPYASLLNLLWKILKMCPGALFDRLVLQAIHDIQLGHISGFVFDKAEARCWEAISRCFLPDKILSGQGYRKKITHIYLAHKTLSLIRALDKRECKNKGEVQHWYTQHRSQCGALHLRRSFFEEYWNRTKKRLKGQNNCDVLVGLLIEKVPFFQVVEADTLKQWLLRTSSDTTPKSMFMPPEPALFYVPPCDDPPPPRK